MLHAALHAAHLHILVCTYILRCSKMTHYAGAADSDGMCLQAPSTGEDRELWVLGDTHGQLQDVLWLFHEHGPPGPNRTYLFNGDIADRGTQAVEILLLISAYKAVWPESVYINRGNHEDKEMSSMFGFSVFRLLRLYLFLCALCSVTLTLSVSLRSLLDYSLSISLRSLLSL